MSMAKLSLAAMLTFPKSQNTMKWMLQYTRYIDIRSLLVQNCISRHLFVQGTEPISQKHVMVKRG